MSTNIDWLTKLSSRTSGRGSGIVRTADYSRAGRLPEEVAVLEKAQRYGATAVFFEAPREGKPAVAQAFIYHSDENSTESSFAKTHQQLWSWGGVPLVYRVTPGLIQLFRCAHKPDFEKGGQLVLQPFSTLQIASAIANDPWWDAERLRSGSLWDDPGVCRDLLSSDRAAQKTLIAAVKDLHEELNEKSILPRPLRRRLLILSVLIAYLEARKVFEPEFFSQFSRNAERFFQILANGPALVKLLDHLEERFNGHVFALQPDEVETLKTSTQLGKFAQLVEGKQEMGGQMTLWERYSFADLPVELISHIYQLFVSDTAVAVYTPHFVVRLMLGEVLSWERLDRLEKQDEVILDGACGSGIFLVEAYKRLVLHWRYRNDWKRPPLSTLKRLLTTRLCGIDLEQGAAELAAFSLCLALCDALEPSDIRSSVKLFPELMGKTIHAQCFFEAREDGIVKSNVGVVVGNPPFTSRLKEGSEQRAYERYRKQFGTLPDKQLAYLFLHESMQMLVPGGILSMLQQYNFLYNQKSKGFRRTFIGRWNVREILDFISVRGLFQKGGADTKVIVVVAEAKEPAPDGRILHATFRRSGRTDAEQGFDIDYYDLHWLSRTLCIQNDAVWRSNSVGGGRVLTFVDRLKKMQTIRQYATQRNWDFGEGWIEAKKGKRVPAEHITGHNWLPSTSLTNDGVDEQAIKKCGAKLFKSYYTAKRFTPPLLLVRSQSDFHHAVWTKGYLTYTQRIIGFAAESSDAPKLRAISRWLSEYRQPLQAYLAATSPRIFTQKSSALSKDDIESLPYDSTGDLKLTWHEQILVKDITQFYRQLIRLGEKSEAMAKEGVPAIPAFNSIYVSQINKVYTKNTLHALDCYV